MRLLAAQRALDALDPVAGDAVARRPLRLLPASPGLAAAQAADLVRSGAAQAVEVNRLAGKIEQAGVEHGRCAPANAGLAHLAQGHCGKVEQKQRGERDSGQVPAAGEMNLVHRPNLPQAGPQGKAVAGSLCGGAAALL